MPGDEEETGLTALSGAGSGDNRLEGVLARLPHGIVLVNRELDVEFVNPAATRLLAGTEPPGRGEPLPERIGDVPLGTLARDLFRDEAPTGRQLAPIEDRIISIDGYPSEGSETVLFVVEDVTDQERGRRAEREFVENAAHELRTPLAAIVSVVEVLDGGAKDDPHARDRFLAHLRSHSERLAHLATSLLALARVQTAQQEPHFELVPLAPLLARVAEDLRPRPGVELSVRAPDRLAALTDPELLRHAVYNVATNAVKYTLRGEIVLQATVTAETVELEIRDSGHGMSRSELDRAFERFHRAPESEGEGFGLGLAIAKEAIEAVGGTIELESKPGEGVRALMRLPGARILS